MTNETIKYKVTTIHGFLFDGEAPASFHTIKLIREVYTKIARDRLHPDYNSELSVAIREYREALSWRLV